MLIDELRRRLANPGAASFQPMGEGLQLITVEDLRAALAAHDAAIPPALDLRDHDTRVEAFGRAFVTAVTGSRTAYQVASEWVRTRFASR